MNFNIIDVYKQHNLSLFHQLPRSPSNTKKSQPGQEVSKSQEVLARPRSQSQAKKSQPGQEVPVRPRNLSTAKKSKPRIPCQAKKAQSGQEVQVRPMQENRYSHAVLIPWGVIDYGKMNIPTLFKFPKFEFTKFKFTNFIIIGISSIIQDCSISCQKVPARSRSPSQAKKSLPGQEVQARPRSPSQVKKSQPGQEVLESQKS